MFLSMQIVAVTHHKQENSNLGKVRSEKWVGGGSKWGQKNVLVAKWGQKNVLV